MKRIRQNTYVERELRRRQFEAAQMMKERIINLISMIGIVIGTEAFFLVIFFA